MCLLDPLCNVLQTDLKIKIIQRSSSTNLVKSYSLFHHRFNILMAFACMLMCLSLICHAGHRETVGEEIKAA